MGWIHFKAEGDVEFKALVFIPKVTGAGGVNTDINTDSCGCGWVGGGCAAHWALVFMPKVRAFHLPAPGRTTRPLLLQLPRLPSPLLGPAAPLRCARPPLTSRYHHPLPKTPPPQRAPYGFFDRFHDRKAASAPTPTAPLLTHPPLVDTPKTAPSELLPSTAAPSAPSPGPTDNPSHTPRIPPRQYAARPLRLL